MGSLKGKNNPSFKHGLSSKHPLYAVWQNMKSRCYNKSLKQYKNYGARGITVCNEWKIYFIKFYDWAIKNGWSHGLTIDRKNNDLGYWPKNCRFVDRIIQSRNQRTRATNKISRGIDINREAYRVRITINGKTFFIGRYHRLYEAIEARKKFINDNNLKYFYS